MKKFTTLKNNAHNRKVIDEIRKLMNRERYTLRVRARSKNRQRLYKKYNNSFCNNDVRMCDAQSFALYIDDKDNEQELNTLRRTVYSLQRRLQQIAELAQ